MRFVRRIVLFTFALHLAPGWMLFQLAGAKTIVSLLGAFGYALASAMLLRGRLELGFDDRPVAPLRAFFERLYYAVWGASLAASVLSVLAVPVLFLLDEGSRRGGFAGVLAAALATGTYAVFVRSRMLRVVRQTITVATLPPAFEGFRIAHLSDVHFGSLYREAAFERVITLTNQEDVDLVALTGDYVTTGNRFHAEAARALGRLRGKHGTLAVLGNHDNFCDREPLLSEFEKRGIVLLRNERFDEIVREGQTLRVVGIDDTFTRRANVAAALDSEGSETTHVALVHDPRVFPELAARGVSLTLAGHTHWGQIGVPFLAKHLNFGRLIFKRFNTSAIEGSARLVVHPGIGTTGPPIRLGIAPTISILSLVGSRGEVLAAGRYEPERTESTKWTESVEVHGARSA